MFKIKIMTMTSFKRLLAFIHVEKHTSEIKIYIAKMLVKMSKFKLG